MYLNCKTYFSLRCSTFSTKELVETAVDLVVTTPTLTNINTTCDIWNFVQFCQEANIKPVAGVEIRNNKTPNILIVANTNCLRAFS